MDIHYELRFVHALALTIISETAVVVPLVYLLTKGAQRRPSPARCIAASCFASLATLPYLWFLLPAFVPSAPVRIIGGELAVAAVEAGVYVLMLNLAVWRACVVSVAANGLSIIVGLVLLPPW